MSDTAAISCEGVWKSYRIYHQRSHTLKERVLSRRHRYEDFWALKGVDLEVPAGTTLGIIGGNGSGKSTLLKTMARILTPNRGSVAVRGTVSPLLELGTGFHPELTGKENVFLAGSLLGQTRRDIQSRYDDIVEFADIPDFMDIPVKNYSSGMYARLAFALAISVDPDILLVDEVLSVGDAGFQSRCYERISELRAQGRTIVLVTHSLDTVRSLCRTAAWIDSGSVRMFGPSDEVVNAYMADVHGTVKKAPGRAETSVSKRGRMTEVEILGGDGRPAATFKTGDPFTVRVRYEVNEPIEELSCAIAVHRADSLAYVFGQSTHSAGIKLVETGQGIVEMRVPRLPLLNGSYLLTLALHQIGTTEVYDFHERRYSFLVFDDPTMPLAAGMFHVDSEWRANPVVPSQVA